MLRIHDADSLHALAADTGAHAADATAAYIPDPHPPLWDDIPPGTLGPAVAVAKAAHVPDVAAPGAGADGPSAAAAPPHGWQLTGLLVGGEASAALIRVPGAGTRTVRTGDALPGTRLRVGDIGDGWLTLREPGGGTHRLALGGVRAGAAVDTGRQR
jgi:hypothetical protein